MSIFWLYLRNTLMVCVLGVIGTVASSSLVGYSLAKIPWRGRGVLFALTLATMMVPFAVLMVPLYTLFARFGWIGTLLASLALPFAWTWLDSWTLWAGLALMGLMGTVGHFMMILAYARAPVSTLTPFLYAQIGFAMLGGWLAFSHVPDDLSLLGMGMIAVQLL